MNNVPNSRLIAILMLWFHYLRTSSPGPPYVHPLGELRAVVGKPFSVICPAAGYPLEKVTWTKGESLNISGCKFNESYISFSRFLG